jgi:hypothetical protein
VLNILNSATDKLQLATSSTADINVHASWVDDLADAMTPGKTNTAIVTATTTDIVATPAASTIRNIKFLSIRNKHASSPNTVTVIYNANGTQYELMKMTLLAGEALVMREGVWFHYDTNGGVYPYTAQPQVDVQTFTATGANTWTKPTTFSPKTVLVKCWGAGGGGGAGASLATAVVAKGGAGGGGGAFVRELLLAADCGATETVTIGTGGTAGAKGAAGAAGGDGGIGGTTSFGPKVLAYGGGGGRGGAISALASGGGGGAGPAARARPARRPAAWAASQARAAPRA